MQIKTSMRYYLVPTKITIIMIIKIKYRPKTCECEEIAGRLESDIAILKNNLSVF
jgi:hypothetical protein